MKVGVIAFNNLKFSPYVFPYVNVLQKIGADIDLIYLDRNGIKEDFLGVNLISVKWRAKKNKVVNFLAFKRDVTKLLTTKNYDFVIVLTTFPAVLLSDVLRRRYRERYLVDVRDFTYEDNRIYYSIEKNVLRDASIRVISSPGFKDFLPDFEYCLCQNTCSEYKTGAKRFSHSTNDKIILGYVGTIAYAQQCKKMIDLIKEDERFCFYFYGNENGTMPITNYVSEVNCERIKCFGEYTPAEKGGIIENIDMMFNVYGNDRPLLRCALSNKLYDSMYFKKPLLVSPDTDMKRESGQFSYAIDFDNIKNLDGLYEWYEKIETQEFESYADAYLKKVFESNEFFENKIAEILKG